MKFTIEAISDPGKMRSNNEDHLLIPWEVFTNGEQRAVMEEEDIFIIAVADGMGGHKAGEVASRRVLESLMEFSGALQTEAQLSALKRELEGWLSHIHHQLVQSGKQDANLEGMGTTLTSFLYYRGRTYILHAGDSRAYIRQQDHITQLTKDHTFSRSTGFTQIKSNLLLNCIGAIRKPILDIMDVSHLTQPGSVFLLCSDGLTDMLEDNEIAYYLKHNTLKQLVEAANERGGRDNISVVTLAIE